MYFAWRRTTKTYYPVKFEDVPTNSATGKPYEEYQDKIKLPKEEENWSLQELARKYPKPV